MTCQVSVTRRLSAGIGRSAPPVTAGELCRLEPTVVAAQVGGRPEKQERRRLVKSHRVTRGGGPATIAAAGLLLHTAVMGPPTVAAAGVTTSDGQVSRQVIPRHSTGMADLSSSLLLQVQTRSD